MIPSHQFQKIICFALNKIFFQVKVYHLKGITLYLSSSCFCTNLPTANLTAKKKNGNISATPLSSSLTSQRLRVRDTCSYKYFWV